MNNTRLLFIKTCLIKPLFKLDSLGTKKHVWAMVLQLVFTMKKALCQTRAYMGHTTNTSDSSYLWLVPLSTNWMLIGILLQ